MYQGSKFVIATKGSEKFKYKGFNIVILRVLLEIYITPPF